MVDEQKIYTTTDMYTKVLLGLVAVGFTAWAGVVYNTGNQAIQAVQVNDIKISKLVEELQDHETRPWHPEAGLQIRETTTKLIHLDQQLDRIEEKLGQALSQSNGR